LRDIATDRIEEFAVAQPVILIDDLRLQERPSPTRYRRPASRVLKKKRHNSPAGRDRRNRLCPGAESRRPFPRASAPRLIELLCRGARLVIFRQSHRGDQV
jgi:hypothetical protein